MRQYLASFDNGHDFIEVKYTSDYRLNSKGNKEDARRQAAAKYGYRAYWWSLRSTQRWEVY